jgi:signal transduction histidine kinase/CheY-like chemotaxis protein
MTAPAVQSSRPVDLEGFPGPVLQLDSKGRVCAINAALTGMVAGRAGELLGRSVPRGLRAVAADRRTNAAGEAFQLGGDSRWFRPAIGKAFAVLNDVTAEVALDELRGANLTSSKLMHEAEVGTWLYDPDRDLYFFSSELSLGHDQAVEGVPTATLQLIQHPADGPKDLRIRERLTTRGGAAESEMRYRDAKGSWRHLRVLYRSGRKTPSGRYLMYGISLNITEQARARDEATAGAHRLKLALDAARAGVFEYDYRKQEFWFSSEYRALVEPDVMSACEGVPLNMFHPEDRAAAMALLTSPQSAHADPLDLRLRSADGCAWVRLYYEIDKYDAEGAPRHGVGLMLDVDAQKRLELALTDARQAAESATAAKSDFLASMSHEIRTPMNGVIGILHLLKRERLSVEAGRLLDEALGCSSMLGQIINDVLDFSKIEAGRLDLAPEPTDLADTLQSVVALVKPQLDAKGLWLKVEAEGLGWATVDPVRLRQCLFNTLGNAAKFTEHGGVAVRMSLSGNGRGRRLRCEVQDTGIGIPDHAKSGLFDRFRQADTGTTRRFGGTGLGLAISRSLARMMGGDMGFDSALGQGSTFWFEIKAPAARAVGGPAGSEDLPAPLAGLNLLVVDDNRVNRLVGVKSLEAMGAAAEAVESGEAALAAVASCRFHLVLMDINMPGMDGMEASRRIRASAGPGAAIPIIAMTADVMPHHQERYRAAGMNGFVPKPFSPMQLLTEVRRVADAGEGAEIEAAA